MPTGCYRVLSGYGASMGCLWGVYGVMVCLWGDGAVPLLCCTHGSAVPPLRCCGGAVWCCSGALTAASWQRCGDAAVVARLRRCTR